MLMSYDSLNFSEESSSKISTASDRIVLPELLYLQTLSLFCLIFSLFNAFCLYPCCSGASRYGPYRRIHVFRRASLAFLLRLSLLAASWLPNQPYSREVEHCLCQCWQPSLEESRQRGFLPNVKLLSLNTVITTGTGIPGSRDCVSALNALQNSMILTPCWPSAGPTGGLDSPDQQVLEA